ncbi:MAG TPA: hypothetical protein VI461_04280, partial [Chitinophagaceae bacterium]|nr:hypothetical protein [Chitinophagaceae bacterium]
MIKLNIVPECYVDTKVAEIAGRHEYNHQHGRGNVANLLKNKLKDKPALGIIDEDKNKGPLPKYFSEFKVIKEENGLLLKYNERNHYLIIFCPEIEKWLLDNANVVTVNPANFNLPTDLTEFKRITKAPNIDTNLHFYRFIKALLKNKAPGLITFQKWIDAFTKNEMPKPS